MKRHQLDAVHFSVRPWRWRVGEWLRRAQADGQHAPFLEGNAAVIRALLSDRQNGLRMVVNIGPDALLSFLRSGRYMNIYERAAVGRVAGVPPERVQVDSQLGIQAGSTYFGALALGGAGVRYYGCYCMAIERTRMPTGTTLFDRDSFDLLAPPLAGRSAARLKLVVRSLRGQWPADGVDMALMKMLPQLPRTQHLMTAGKVSRLVLNDQEFVEVHWPGPLTPGHVEEVRESTRDLALDASIRDSWRRGRPPSLVQMRWVAAREAVAGELRRRGLRSRVASHLGQGESWQ